MILRNLQLIQNAAARIVTRKSKFDSVANILAELHWLPMEKRIEFKVLLMTYKIINGFAPSYLSDLLKIYQPIRTLRSCSKFLLDKSYVRGINDGTLFLWEKKF